MKNFSRMTDNNNFYNGNDPNKLIKQFGSPLYVYNESIVRRNCRELKNLSSYSDFRVNYSAKANSNLAILQIVRQEGLCADAMSPGEILLELAAGFKPEQILFIPNNVSAAEFCFAASKGITVSVDSISQLELFGKTNQGGRVAVRFNPGVGAGHHEKVITAGKNTKFGVSPDDIGVVKELLERYKLKLVGINQHIGSHFMTGDKYLESIVNLFKIAKCFEGLEFVDMGGGFGIPYHKQDDENRLDIQALGSVLTERMNNFASEYGKVAFIVEPGRYIPAEAGVLLGTVHAIKTNGDTKYIGTDLGMNVLIRPALYGSHHDIEVYRTGGGIEQSETETVTVVGNICETGDILAKDRILPIMREGDLIGVMDAGSYGYSMSSNYNIRLRPAELLIRENGNVQIIRRRDSYDDMIGMMTGIES